MKTRLFTRTPGMTLAGMLTLTGVGMLGFGPAAQAEGGEQLVILSAFVDSALAQVPGWRGVWKTGVSLDEPPMSVAATIAEWDDAEGQITRKWNELRGAPGQPKVAGRDGLVPIGDGYYHEYVSGDTARIYYRRGHEPFFVYGFIGNRYAALGGPQSWLGWPTSDEQPFPQDGRASTFEHGAIYWWYDTGAIELGNIGVRYSGLYCFGETDNDQGSSADEPYVLFGVIPATGQPSETRTRIYDDDDDGVDAGDSREDDIELYRGLPYGLTLSVTLWEHDFSDPDQYRGAVKTAVGLASKAVAAAAGALAGPEAAAAVETVLAAAGDDITKAVHDALDFEDDYLDTKSFVITAKQMVTLARAARQNLKGIQWQLDSPLLSGDGASYKVYVVIEAL